MLLQGTKTYRENLANAVSEAKEHIIILSGFVTSSGVQWLVDLLKGKSVNCDIVVRWRLDDLLSGASSLDVYKAIRKVGWNLYICPELHGKAVLVDNKELHLGSANLTGSGLGLTPKCNIELGVSFEAKVRDIRSLYLIRDEAVLVNDELYEAIERHLLSIKRKSRASEEWPDSIKDYYQPSPQYLWIEDLFWTKPLEGELPFAKSEDRSIDHDSHILGLHSGLKNASIDEIRNAITATRVWLWLYNALLERGEDGLFFGALSSSLQNSLLDDPSPYRKDVKELVQNIYAWLTFIDLPNVIIDQPGRRSERIRLLSSF